MHVLHDRDLAGCRQIIPTHFLLFKRRYTKKVIKNDRALIILRSYGFYIKHVHVHEHEYYREILDFYSSFVGLSLRISHSCMPSRVVRIHKDNVMGPTDYHF